MGTLQSELDKLMYGEKQVKPLKRKPAISENKSEFQIICPHNKPIKIRRSLGLIAYYHDDDTSCETMNSFSVASDGILSQRVRYHSEDKRGVLVSLNNSAKARDIFYLRIARTKDETKLSELIDYCVSLADNTDILSEMIIALGNPILQHLEAKAGKLYSFNVPSHVYTKVMGAKPKYQLDPPKQKDKVAQFIDDLTGEVVEGIRKSVDDNMDRIVSEMMGDGKLKLNDSAFGFGNSKSHSRKVEYDPNGLIKSIGGGSLVNDSEPPF